MARFLPVGTSSSRFGCRLLGTAAAPPQPLAGVRVLDCTRILAGPWCTQLLGDLGADVIKVEPVRGGDDTRAWGPPFLRGQSAYFLCANRNKRSLAIDLKSPRGKDIMYALVRSCDVFVENFLPGKLTALGYGPDALRAIKPDIVYASMSGFGARGPMTQRAGYDVAVAAHAGLLAITGTPDGPPVKPGVALTDITTGLYLHGAILAALLHRQRTGQGAVIDTSLLECQIATLANIGSNALIAGKVPQRWGTAHESIAPYQAFPASDGELIVAAMNDTQFRALCRVLGLTHVAEDERFTTNPSRVAHRRDLIPILSHVLSTKPRAHWIRELNQVGVTASSINSVTEALHDPQVQYLGMVTQVDMPAIAERFPATAHPVNYDGARPAIRRPPPLLGEHTAEVLREAGISDVDIQQLEQQRVIACAAIAVS